MTAICQKCSGVRLNRKDHTDSCPQRENTTRICCPPPSEVAQKPENTRPARLKLDAGFQS